MAKTELKTPSRKTKLTASDPSICLVLGGGGARGISHILILEVLDELGIVPRQILGTSIGAIFGAAYASGLSARDIRQFAMEALSKRTEILKKLFLQKPDTLRELWNLTPLRSSLMNPERLLEMVLPKQIAKDFTELKIPAKFVATDFYAQKAVALDFGSVHKAVAASMALPAIFTPVEYEGTPFIDGGMTNPLPFDLSFPAMQVTIAVDVTGGPVRDEKGKKPAPMDVLFAASQIQQNSIVNEKLKTRQPEILIRPPVDHIQVLAFYKIKEILAEAAPVKDELKRKLEKHIKAGAQQKKT